MDKREIRVGNIVKWDDYTKTISDIYDNCVMFDDNDFEVLLDDIEPAKMEEYFAINFGFKEENSWGISAYRKGNIVVARNFVGSYDKEWYVTIDNDLYIHRFFFDYVHTLQNICADICGIFLELKHDR